MQTKGRESGSNWGRENKKILKQATPPKDRNLIKLPLGGSPDLEGWNIRVMIGVKQGAREQNIDLFR